MLRRWGAEKQVAFLSSIAEHTELSSIIINAKSGGCQFHHPTKPNWWRVKRRPARLSNESRVPSELSTCPFGRYTFHSNCPQNPRSDASTQNRSQLPSLQWVCLQLPWLSAKHKTPLISLETPYGRRNLPRSLPRCHEHKGIANWPCGTDCWGLHPIWLFLHRGAGAFHRENWTWRYSLPSTWTAWAWRSSWKHCDRTPWLGNR